MMHPFPARPRCSSATGGTVSRQFARPHSQLSSGRSCSPIRACPEPLIADTLADARSSSGTTASAAVRRRRRSPRAARRVAARSRTGDSGASLMSPPIVAAEVCSNPRACGRTFRRARGMRPARVPAAPMSTVLSTATLPGSANALPSGVDGAVNTGAADRFAGQPARLANRPRRRAPRGAPAGIGHDCCAGFSTGGISS
jgi:hypothetical protein